MRRIYALIWGLSLVGVFYWGYQSGSSGEPTTDLSAIKKAFDSLQVALNASQAREFAYQEKVSQNATEIDFLQQEMEARGAIIITQRKSYEKRIKDAERYTATQLDSFFAARYPRPGVRIPTDTAGHHDPDTSVARPDAGPDGTALRLSKQRSTIPDEKLSNTDQDIQPSEGITAPAAARDFGTAVSDKPPAPADYGVKENGAYHHPSGAADQGIKKADQISIDRLRGGYCRL